MFANEETAHFCVNMCTDYHFFSFQKSREDVLLNFCYENAFVNVVKLFQFTAIRSLEFFKVLRLLVTNANGKTIHSLEYKSCSMCF